MYRHSPNRHQKSKGVRLKHVLQICVLVAVCFWLIYQVKHSHYKRKQFDENDAKISRDVEMSNGILALGRKGLNPLEKGPNKDLESHDEEAEEEIVEEDKNEEENREQDKNEEVGEEDKHEEEIEEEDKHGEESEEEDKHEEESGEGDKNEEETGEDKHEEETGEEDKHGEETGEEDKHEEETGEEDKHEDENGEEDKHEETGLEDRHGKEEQEENTETEEKGDEGGGGGDDDVNEEEQQKIDSNVNQEEEFIDEEKNKQETDEKETEEKDDNDKDSQLKKNSLLEDHDHDAGSRNTREAREEQYKGDDASSAVTHDGQITSTENVGSMEHQASGVENKNKHNKAEEGNTGQNTTDVNLLELEAAGNGNSTSNKENISEVLDSISRGNSSLTSITALESNGQSETIIYRDTRDSSTKNETEIIMPNSSHSYNVTDGNVTAAEETNLKTLVMEQSDNSTVALENAKHNSNSSSSIATGNVEEIPEESRDSSINSEFVSSETLAQSNVSTENKDGSESTTTMESTNEAWNENPENIEGTEGTYEKSDSSSSEDTDEVQHDSIDSSDSSVLVNDKENHIDLDTLPDIRTEGSNSEEVAEE